FARAPSPNINEKRHITPSLLFKQNSCVLPNTPMSTGTRGISSAPANIVYGPGASDIILEGEGTFVDCFPGRLHSDYHGHVNKVDELVVNKQERVRSADLVLRLQGAKLPDFREPTPVESPMIASRGVGIGGSYAVDVTLPIGAFDGSESPEDNYEFPFVFD
ncbi:MAG: hypothetical protein QGG83_05490, partial [Candidatus Woesearchaeota archaeon]|nr:hypothetical protein [Candidatus Woesearchaeota archaeon]